MQSSFPNADQTTKSPQTAASEEKTALVSEGLGSDDLWGPWPLVTHQRYPQPMTGP